MNWFQAIAILVWAVLIPLGFYCLLTKDHGRKRETKIVQAAKPIQKKERVRVESQPSMADVEHARRKAWESLSDEYRDAHPFDVPPIAPITYYPATPHGRPPLVSDLIGLPADIRNAREEFEQRAQNIGVVTGQHIMTAKPK